jgi:hypothetical protein
MAVIVDQVQTLLERKFQEANLSQFVNRDHSQFLDLSGGEVFAEVVLNEGSALDEAEKLVSQIAEELSQHGIRLNSVVRALWEIASIEYLGDSTTPDFAQGRAAEEFRVILKAGSRQQAIRVDVTWAAIDIIRHKLGLEYPGTPPNHSLSPEHVLREIVAPVVRTFLEEQLRHGGINYWDLLLSSHLELTATDMSFLLGQSTAFDELRQAISDAFDPPVVDSFLSSLSTSGIKIRDFDAVLPELSNMLGGAYRKRETFSTSASDLYRRLDRTEQELLRKYFEGNLDQLKSDPRFAALPNKYPGIFAEG